MLNIENVTGGYLNIPVLKDISFSVGNGELVGLIGLNGAGKSTTINEIIGFLKPYKGRISIDGLTLAEHEADYRKKIGFIPETPSLYEELTLAEHINTVAMAYDIDVELAHKRAEPFLELFRLTDKLDWFPVHFSKGMKQKVMIICAFVIDPSLFILDEPFLGLDPLAIADLIKALEVEKAKGKSILMSTHVLDSAEKMCDRFVILHQGQVRAQGTLADLQAVFGDASASLNDIYLALTKEG
ncbi:TPA: ABC transporter ATP-binding protein [Streptococcus equi subsp. zooepidemicus]|uniref:ABC transporter ATP-binding protein n=3 Tax=Streptococcus equi TaxID=1336 RepID=C0M8F4_STRE4|nr:ABC transporter ATP-binding protein [Streptococcus equi]HEL1016553.1 ABC transporter ATP-binding protein [Streptococcus equi subsp. ruminatorum]AEJ24654.1 ABC transporter ATP-binding protein [Streptococcus equi subsp. zooepidemicus ATCC 35246]AIA68008.1 multidrug ABC transporter ATP-binding protein [Streptococcus equi subsp. zooepidemicus CY]ASB96135.1 ABC transporter ATP-binding protein [Streptococcus equi subsp. equi]KIQ75698.1 multidrug ABC transporter ATP-binding protein [Streptococcus 